MKLTDKKREWINQKINYYCNLLKVKIPRIILTHSEYEKFKKELREKYNHIRVGRSNYLGVCHRAEKVIIIRVKHLPNCKELDYTIRHELLHYAKPSYNHYSKEFYDRLKRLKQGKLNQEGRFIK